MIGITISLLNINILNPCIYLPMLIKSSLKYHTFKIDQPGHILMIMQSNNSLKKNLSTNDYHISKKYSILVFMIMISKN